MPDRVLRTRVGHDRLRGGDLEVWMAAPEGPRTPADAPIRAVAAVPLSGAPGHLVRCAQQVHSAFWHLEFGGELTSPQYAVLSTLAAHPDIDQRTAGGITSLDKSTIADVVRRLEHRGWLTRVRDTDDARRNLLRLTDTATDALAESSPRVARVQSQLLGRLDPADRDRFLALLGRVAYRSEDAVPGADEPTGPVRVQLATAPGHLIRRTEQVHYALWSAEFEGRLTSPQYAVLSALVHSAGALDQRTAGEIASLDKSSIADVVHRLAKRGWLTRVRDTGDARRQLIELTPAALYAIPEVTDGVRRVQERLMAPLAAAEQRSLIDGLAAIVGSA